MKYRHSSSFFLKETAFYWCFLKVPYVSEMLPVELTGRELGERHLMA